MKDQIELIIKIANQMDLLHQHQIADHMDEIAHHTLDLSEEKFHSYMAKPQLAQIAEMAEELYNSIPDGATLPDWAESKIAVMADNIQSIHRKMKHNLRGYEVQK